MDTEESASARGNHFGCASQGSASTGVFGMLSSTILAVQVRSFKNEFFLYVGGLGTKIRI